MKLSKINLDGKIKFWRAITFISFSLLFFTEFFPIFESIDFPSPPPGYYQDKIYNIKKEGHDKLENYQNQKEEFIKRNVNNKREVILVAADVMNLSNDRINYLSYLSVAYDIVMDMYRPFTFPDNHFRLDKKIAKKFNYITSKINDDMIEIKRCDTEIREINSNIYKGLTNTTSEFSSDAHVSTIKGLLFFIDNKNNKNEAKCNSAVEKFMIHFNELTMIYPDVINAVKEKEKVKENISHFIHFLLSFLLAIGLSKSKIKILGQASDALK